MVGEERRCCPASAANATLGFSPAHPRYSARATPSGRGPKRLTVALMPGPSGTFVLRRDHLTVAAPPRPLTANPQGVPCPRSSTASATASTASRCTARSTPSRPTPSLGVFQFRAHNHWIDGAHNRSTIKALLRRRPGGRDARRSAFTLDAGEPAILLGTDTGAEPGRAPAARARRVPDDVAGLRRGGAQGAPDRGRVDARGRHGRPRRARPLRRGAQRLHAASACSFKVKGDAPPEKLREVVERAQARSAVFDMVTNGVPVEVGTSSPT